MAIRKSVLIIIMSAALFAGACTHKPTGAKGNAPVEAAAPQWSVAGVIKGLKLAKFESMTIGNAFDSYKYLKKKEWTWASLKGGEFTVDFIGWAEPTGEEIKAGLKAKGIDVKFVIEPDGAYYVLMILKLQTGPDGKVSSSPLADTMGILAKIYANDKIDL